MNIIGIIGAMPIEINLIKENIEVIEEKEYAGFKFYIGEKENIKIVLTSCSIGSSELYTNTN